MDAERLCECGHTAQLHDRNHFVRPSPFTGITWEFEPCQKCRYEANFNIRPPEEICNTYREMDNLQWLLYLENHDPDA